MSARKTIFALLKFEGTSGFVFLSVLTPSRPRRNPPDVIKRILLGREKYPLWITKATLRQTAQEVSREIVRLQPDALLSISSQCVAYLDPLPVPAFLFADAPWMAYHEAYAQWDTMPRRGAAFAQEEARAARRLNGLFFGSEWACTEALRLYATENEPFTGKLHITPLGANSVSAISRDKIMASLEKRAHDCIDLLFVGKDWERKGGPMAVEAARLLHQAGHKVRLHIVGCQPVLPTSFTDSEGFVVPHGFLDRAKEDENAKLSKLFLESHFLIVPTTAECYGIVFAEAQAYALPPIARSVHALPSVILDGVTGILLDKDAPASAYVERILDVMARDGSYKTMAQRAHERFESTLNWDATASEMLRIISAALPGNGAVSPSSAA